MKILIRVLVGFKTGEIHHFLCVRKTQPSLRRSVFKLFINLIRGWGLHGICKINITHMSITFQNGSSIFCVSMDDLEKLKSITDVTSCWLEEATELSVEEAQQINLRLRGPSDSYKQLIYSLNPISKLNWVYKRFYVEKDDNVFTHHSTYKDNRFLDEEYKKELNDLVKQDSNAYKVYCLGKWGSLGSVVYRNYEIIEVMPTTGGEIVYGLDFGWNAPCAMVEVRKIANEYYLKEVIYERKKTIPQLISWCKKINHMRRPIYCDSADPSKTAEMRMSNILAIDAKKGAGSVERGIEFIKRNKFYVDYNSVNLIKELSGYVYKKDREGNVTDKPVEYNDHLMDAMRYCIIGHWGMVGKRHYGFIY